MENGRSAGAGAAAAAAAGSWLTKNRASSSPVSMSEEAAAGTEPPGSAWTGEKKAKIQSTPTPGDLGNAARVDADHSSGGQEQIEGLDWDEDKLSNEIASHLERLNDGPPEDDEESLAFCDEQQLKELNQRHTLCHIRAHEEKYRGMDDASLLAVFPPSNLEDNWYYKLYELGLQWRFDNVYCHYVHLQDYQRLILQDNGEYQDWEYYYKTCSTLEGDQEFVQFWDELSSKTELIELHLTGRSRKLVSEQKLDFKDALRQVFDRGNTMFIFSFRDEFEPNIRSKEEHYKPHLDRIVEKAQEGHDVNELIKDTVRKIVRKPNTYYDYAKKKLGIAEEIGLIPPQPPILADRHSSIP